MAFQGTAIDEDIIDENQHPFAQERAQYNVHSILESGRSSRDTIRHDFEVEMAMVSLEGCLCFTSRAHTDFDASQSANPD